MPDPPAERPDRQHRVFLDANVLFSAAYHPNARLRRLWALPAPPHLLSSPYAVAEARRNLESSARGRLDQLVAALEIVPDTLHGELPGGVTLPEKDRPILLTALAAGATHLLTGDWTHFGPYFGLVAGLRIEPPGAYLRRALESPPS